MAVWKAAKIPLMDAGRKSGLEIGLRWPEIRAQANHQGQFLTREEHERLDDRGQAAV
jgi:hypothetical protein